MPDPRTNSDFLEKTGDIIRQHISDDRFGVSELARLLGMSRSNLLRRIKKLTGLSASRFINQVRLEQARKMLLDGDLNVSEIAYNVGFSSPSYFIKCYHEHYGYPPGETANAENNMAENEDDTVEKRMSLLLWPVVSIVALAIIVFIFFNPFDTPGSTQGKSIAVLPFRNDSDDSTNQYLINGLMESILNNLQQVEGLRVISRTSVEKYRTIATTIPEIASELGVDYFVEGSGQKVGDQVLLNIQLVEAKDDRHLWAEQFRRETGDIFSLQNEIALQIVNKVEVTLTAEERRRIEKVPTHNPVAYDLFLKGLDILHRNEQEHLQEAIMLFHEAIAHDNSYARAYAAIAIAYYALDADKFDKVYADSINKYADLAMFHDDHLAQSLVAKALFYMESGAYDLAVPYFEKALEYNPNSALVIEFLSDYYVNHVPDTRKYLEYALKGVNLDLHSHDSIEASFLLLHVSNAFIQSGFVKEALQYIDRSLAFYPQNIYSAYVKPYIQYAEDKDLGQLRDRLLRVLAKDPGSLDILQEVGKVYYFLGDYKRAYTYYNRFNEARKARNLDIYASENAKIAMVYRKMGMKGEAEELLSNFKAYTEQDPSIYRDLNWSVYYASQGDEEQALEYLDRFSRKENYFYWVVLFLDIDPVYGAMSESSEFQRIKYRIDARFREYHESVRRMLLEKDLI